jgi:hypothetical protein
MQPRKLQSLRHSKEDPPDEQPEAQRERKKRGRGWKELDSEEGERGLK